MRNKSKKYEDSTLYLPGYLFKKRFMPPYKIVVDPGEWKAQPLYLATLKDSKKLTLPFFGKERKEEQQ